MASKREEDVRFSAILFEVALVSNWPHLVFRTQIVARRSGSVNRKPPSGLKMPVRLGAHPSTLNVLEILRHGPSCGVEKRFGRTCKSRRPELSP